MNDNEITGVTDISMTGLLKGNGTANIQDFNEINANVKNFDIPHPSKEGWRLRYSVLEGPEYGVYIRGKVEGDGVITLPDYWKDLIYEDSLSVQLTPIGKSCAHYVLSASTEQVVVACECGEVNAYYIVFAERKVDPKLIIEYPEKD
jgi:3-dehydroquinate synthase class II